MLFIFLKHTYTEIFVQVILKSTTFTPHILRILYLICKPFTSIKVFVCMPYSYLAEDIEEECAWLKAEIRPAAMHSPYYFKTLFSLSRKVQAISCPYHFRCISYQINITISRYIKYVSPLCTFYFHVF